MRMQKIDWLVASGVIFTVMIVAGLIIAFNENEELRHPSQRALETITRYETVINGERIECERREDHVRGTTEVAC